MSNNLSNVPVNSSNSEYNGTSREDVTIAKKAYHDAAIKQEKALQDLKRKNAKELFDLKKAYAEKEITAQFEREKEIATKMLELGKIFDQDQLDTLQKRKFKEIDKEIKRQTKAQGWSEEKAKKEKEAAQKKAQDALNAQFKKDQEFKTKLEIEAENKVHEEKRKKTKELADTITGAWGNLASSKSLGDFTKNFSKAFSDTKQALLDSGLSGGKANLAAGIKALSGIAGALNEQIDSIASSKTLIDTRLQGSNNERKWGIQGKSYWERFSSDITGIAGASPFVKQADVVTNLKSMVESGISFNVEQRAFLATIKDKIADTFEANDATLLRLIRIQEADSTASRLGMESAMTAFLNNMYENTEYLKGVAESVRSNIQEASALMSATEAVGFEYQVQKWMGSLYSVGFGKTTELASALGQLAAGDISGLTGSGTGNLMIMAANKAGLSLGDVLANGLDDSTTNQLMKAMVEYLGGIYNESKGSRVVQQQMAGVYGLAASDLKAAANILNDTNTISKNNLDYNGGIARLNQMASTMYQRTSIGDMMSNTWDNVMYSMAAGIANNSALYGTYKVSNLLDAFGGINIPALSVAGFGSDLNATVADLMKIGAFSGGILSSLGNMIGIGNGSGGGGGFSGKLMLNALGIGNNITTISRGSGDVGITTSNESTSSSTFVGNKDGSAVQSKTLTDANDDANKQLAAKQEEQTEATTTMINDNVISILELLRDVVNGTSSFTIKQNNFGLM